MSTTDEHPIVVSGEGTPKANGETYWGMSQQDRLGLERLVRIGFCWGLTQPMATTGYGE
jgi:hypothetical protein